MSQLKTNSITNIANTGDANITMAADGSIDCASDVQMSSLNGGQLGGRRSLIVNGGMEIAQRGVGPTGTTKVYATVDRMQNMCGGSFPEHSNSRQGGIGANEAPLADGHRNYFRITNADTTVTNGTYRNFRYNVEAPDIARCGWIPTDPESKMTISFWARSSVAFTPKLWLNMSQNGGLVYDDDSRTYNVNMPLAANTWTKIEHTFSGQAGNTLIPVSSGVAGLSMGVALYWGTNYTTTDQPEGSWFNFVSAGRFNAMGSEWVSQNNATFDITGLQLELGDVATPYEHRRYSDQLRDCQRYYYKIGSAGIRLYTVEHTNSSRYLRIPRPVPMASSPTEETGSPSGGDLTFFGDPDTLRIQASGLPSGNGVIVNNYTASAEI